jgi:arsenate reductase
LGQADGVKAKEKRKQEHHKNPGWMSMPTENVTFAIQTGYEMKILILCTGNSCRSQMAEGFLRSFDPELQVFSAGTAPADRVHPKAVDVMGEVGIDLASHVPQKVDEFLEQAFDFVITVCGHAQENCPIFLGNVKQRLHMGYDDPAEATGSQEEIYAEFRRIRDEIREGFYDFYLKRIKR